MTSQRIPLGFLLAGLACAVGWQTLRAQPVGPPPPKEYEVQVRYRILAARNERLAQFNAMIGYLESVGFKKDAGPDDEAENASYNRMTGTIASANVRKLIIEPHVRSVLLLPAGYKLPAETELVKVQLELATGLAPDRQHLLAVQTLDKLKQFGFREAIGYDHRSYTRLVGRIPASELETLLKDLRMQPSGWLVPVTPVAELPLPLRNVSPILITEVIPEPQGLPPAKEPPAFREPPPEQSHLRKIAQDLQALLSTEGGAAQTIRMEVILSSTPGPDERGWMRLLATTVDGMLIEGRLGPLVTVRAPARAAAALAQLAEVDTVRLPRSGKPANVGTLADAAGIRKALEASGVARLHSQGYRGQGIRVAVIASDFRGYAGLVGKSLPKRTRLVDLTTERNPGLEPDPFAGDPRAVGAGTQRALAVAAAAPEAELVLIRVDPAAPFQLLSIAHYIQGELVRSESLDARLQELNEERDRLRRRSDELLVERRVVLNNFGQDEASKNRREAYFQQQKQLDSDEEAYSERVSRYLRLRRELLGLRGIRVVANSLVWNEGHPANGSGPLSRYFDDQPFQAALWFQAAGDTRGQTWYGFFHDADENGVMEFAPPGSRLGSGRWTRELNFLGWQASPRQAGDSSVPVADLPAKARVRVSIQWQEAHDAEASTGRNEDPYREPIVNLRLLLLRQRDPSGKQLSTDDMEVVARSGGLAQRLVRSANSAVYEQTVEFTTEAAGRFALRVEGKTPTCTLPASQPSLPAQEKAWDLWPRIFVETVDEASPARGRPVFLDYAPSAGGMAMPGDAHRAITVGASDLSGQAQPASAGGPPMGMALLVKPDLLGYDAGGGTGFAASFAAGLAASALSGGLPAERFYEDLRLRRGGLLRVPERWSAPNASPKPR